MHRKLYLTLALLLTFIMVLPAFGAVQRIEMPRLDQINAIVETDPDLAWLRFQAGEFDFMPDIIRADIISEAQAAGHNTQSMPGFHVCYTGINTRDYVPSDGGAPDAGRALAPLNYTSFRLGLAWSGMSKAQKEAAIGEIYGAGVNVAAITIIPEALGVWHNPNVTSPGGNYTKAWELMEAGGFYIDTGILYQPNGVQVRNLIEVLSPASAPTSVEFCQRFVDQWNDFFDNHLGVTNCNLVNLAIDFNIEVVMAFAYRNFDMYWLCWGLGRFPDYIYDFFHSSQDFPWGYNSPGLNDPELDSYIETVKWGLVYEEKLDAAHQFQHLLVEDLIGYIFFYHRIYWTVTRNGPGIPPYGPAGPTGELVNVVNQDGVGSDNGWTWNLMHWNTSLEGGVVNYNWGHEPDNMHPGWADSAYEVWLIGECLDGLTAVNPSLEDMAWIACDWDVVTFDWPPLNIYDGTQVTFRIRDNVYWHDGWPVTIEDIKFSWEFMANFPRFYSTYQYLMWVEIHDPNTITAYLNITSQYIVYDYAGLALYFPEHIYNPDYHPTRDPVLDRVDEIDWTSWMADYTGPIPNEVSGWTPGMPSPNAPMPTYALVGCGPYWFFDYNAGAETAVIKKNPNYWVQGPVCCCIDAPGRIDPDTDYPFDVVICNQGAKDEGTGDIVAVDIDYFDVYIDAAYVTTVAVGASIDPFTCIRVPVPGGVLNLPKGAHEVCIYVYEEGDPIEPIVICCKLIYVTIREDLNYDMKVDVKDIFAAAKAFGSQPPPFPGSDRWDERADVNDDYKVDVKDIFAIAKLFGWA
jgi:ABC-type transport system substrate-binding protein